MPVGCHSKVASSCRIGADLASGDLGVFLWMGGGGFVLLLVGCLVDCLLLLVDCLVLLLVDCLVLLLVVCLLVLLLIDCPIVTQLAWRSNVNWCK